MGFLKNVLFRKNETAEKLKIAPDEIDKENLPLHIAIIMDGNGRWAAKRGLPRNVGHSRGADALRDIVKEADNIGIKYITTYAFSTENWNRPQSEVDSLMNLLLSFLRNADNEIGGRNIRIRVIGSTEGLSDDIKAEIDRVTRKTMNNDGLTLIIALNYGSREELTTAVRTIAAKVLSGDIKPEEIDQNLISEYLYTAGIPDPDLMIRPSGEQRISNFLLWQLSYSELWFSETLWPDFKKEHLVKAIVDYQRRNRRFGGI